MLLLFQNYLLHELYFETKYEVALLEEMYSHHFYNLVDQRIKISYVERSQSKHVRINLVDGYYSNIEELIEEINDTIQTNSSIHKSMKSQFDIDYSKLTKKQHLQLKVM